MRWTESEDRGPVPTARGQPAASADEHRLVRADPDRGAIEEELMSTRRTPGDQASGRSSLTAWTGKSMPWARRRATASETSLQYTLG